MCLPFESVLNDNNKSIYDIHLEWKERTLLLAPTNRFIITYRFSFWPLKKRRPCRFMFLNAFSPLFSWLNHAVQWNHLILIRFGHLTALRGMKSWFFPLLPRLRIHIFDMSWPRCCRSASTSSSSVKVRSRSSGFPPPISTSSSSSSLDKSPLMSYSSSSLNSTGTTSNLSLRVSRWWGTIAMSAARAEPCRIFTALSAEE